MQQIINVSFKNKMTKVEKLLQQIKEVFTPEQAKALEDLVNLLNELVKASDFNELKAIVAEISKDIKELAEAQKRTEQRVNELAEAQKRTEQRVEILAKKVEELAEAQKRTEQRVNELAEAQKRTDKALRELTEEHKKTRKELGNVSHTVGYILEDRSYFGLPKLLEEDFGIKVTSRLIRKNMPYKGGRIEINILGRGTKDNQDIWIIGEAKSQLKKKDVDKFINRRKIFNELFPGPKLFIIVTYTTTEEIEKYAKEKDIKIYYSYQLPL
ncbi:MAG: chordopoxvirus fusion protein [bacterium]|nr:chordopoxvirus fusion protein [bacterium]